MFLLYLCNEALSDCPELNEYMFVDLVFVHGVFFFWPFQICLFNNQPLHDFEHDSHFTEFVPLPDV